MIKLLNRLCPTDSFFMCLKIKYIALRKRRDSFWETSLSIKEGIIERVCRGIVIKERKRPDV